MPVYPYEKKPKKGEKNVPWYYYAFEVRDAEGKRKTIQKYGFKKQQEAKAAEQIASLAWRKGTHIETSKEVFGVYITNWLEKKQNLSEQSRYTNNGHLNNHIIPFMGHRKLPDIDVDIIEDFVIYLQTKKLKNDKQLSPATVKKIFNIVQTCLNAAVKKEHISRNPCDLLDTKPTVGKVKMDYWNKEEVNAFINALDHRLKLLFILAIRTGMRRGELLALRLSDINFENGKIHINQILGFFGKIKPGAKTAAGNRSISVTPTVLEAIKKHRLMVLKEKLVAGEKYEDNDLLFCSEIGKAISWGNFHKFWARIVTKTNSRYIRFHDLRHTCATLLLQTPGVHPKVVQELLGHSSIKITLDTYSSVLPNMQSDAVLLMEYMLEEKNNEPQKSTSKL